MAAPKVPLPGQNGGVGSVARDRASIEAQARTSKISDILQQLGLSDPNQLGPRSRQELDTIIASNEKFLSGIDVPGSAAQIKRAFAADYGSAFAPTFEPGGSTAIKAGIRLTQEKKGGGQDESHYAKSA